MRATVLAMTFLATAFGHAASTGDDDSADKAAKTEAVAQTRSQMEAVQAQMEAARIQLEAARAEMAAAAKQMAAAASKGLRTAYKERPFLGVMIGGQSEDGIVVAGVTPDGGAEAAGIEPKDVITAVGGESLTGHRRPLRILERILEGITPSRDGIEVVVSRGGETRSFDVVPAKNTVVAYGSTPLTGLDEALQVDVLPRAAMRNIERLWDGFHRRERAMSIRPEGIHFVDIGEDLGDYFGVDGGVLVLNAPAKSELKPGDIVRRIDGADVASSDEAYGLLAGTSGEDAQVAQVEVRRKNRKVEVTASKLPLKHQTIRTLSSSDPGKETVIVRGSVLSTDPEVEVDVEVEILGAQDAD